MVETTSAADVPGCTAGAKPILSIAVTGVVTVVIGLLAAPEYPVLGATILGVPAGLIVWLSLREAMLLTIGWPLAADDDPPDR